MGDARERTTAEDELAQRISVRIFLQKRDNAKKRADRSGQAGYGCCVVERQVEEKGVVGRGWFVTDGGQEVEEEEEVVVGG